MALAQTKIFSAGWLFIFLVGALLLAYAFLTPADTLGALGRYTPAWVVAVLDWSEERGWAGRALSGSGSGGTASSPPAAPVTQAPTLDTRTTEAASRSRLQLSASTEAIAAGGQLTLMARASSAAGTTEVTGVRFYDGNALLGSAELKVEGGARIAYLTVSRLEPGVHEVRAEAIGPFGAGAGTSDAVRVTVFSRRRP